MTRARERPVPAANAVGSELAIHRRPIQPLEWIGSAQSMVGRVPKTRRKYH